MMGGSPVRPVDGSHGYPGLEMGANGSPSRFFLEVPGIENLAPWIHLQSCFRAVDIKHDMVKHPAMIFFYFDIQEALVRKFLARLPANCLWQILIVHGLET